MLRCFISVDYDEFKPDTYRGIEYKISTTERVVVEQSKVFSDDPQQDWKRIIGYVTPICTRVQCSSSVDDFISDSGLQFEGR